MIRVYYLGTEIVNKAECPRGIDYIHDAILGIEGTQRKLTQDTTEEEHTGLIAVADSWRDADEKEINQLNDMKASLPTEPARDILKEIDELKASINLFERR